MAFRRGVQRKGWVPEPPTGREAEGFEGAGRTARPEPLPHPRAALGARGSVAPDVPEALVPVTAFAGCCDTWRSHLTWCLLHSYRSAMMSNVIYGLVTP